MDVLERLARALGCQYLSDLHYLSISREEAKRFLSQMDPPLTESEYDVLRQYLANGASRGKADDAAVIDQCASMLAHERGPRASK